MSTPKGTAPWNRGRGEGWADKRGYRWRSVQVADGTIAVLARLRGENARLSALNAEMYESLREIVAAFRIPEGYALMSPVQASEFELRARAILARIDGAA